MNEPETAAPTAPENPPPAPPQNPPAYFQVPANVGHVARLAGREGEHRLPAITCVRLAVDPAGRYSACATDGRTLGLLTGASGGPDSAAMPPRDDEAPSHGNALVPARQFRAITRRVRKDPNGRLRLKLAAPGGPCRVDVSDRRSVSTWRVDAASGRFPDPGAVMPKGEPAAFVNVDPAQLARLLDVCRRLGDVAPNVTRVEVYGPGVPLVVRCKGRQGQEFVGLLMPMT